MISNQRIIVIFLIAFTLVSCNNSADPSAEIRVGAIFSQSGVAGDYGKKSVEGIRLAVQQIDSAGGINGKQLTVIYEDAKSSPRDALSAFRKLVDIDKVKIIVGDVYSSTTKALIENLPPDVMIFAPGASKPDLVKLNPNFLRNWTSDDFDGLAMANIITADSVKALATLTQVSDYTISLNDAFRTEFRAKGGTIQSEETFEGEKNDYRPVLNNLKSKGIKYIYLTALSKEMGLILKQALEINYRPQWYTNLTVNTDDCKKIAGKGIDKVIFSRPYIDLAGLSKESLQFVQDYKKKMGSEPDETATHSYDAINILTVALKAVGDTVPSLVQYINRLKNYPGLSGKTTFDGKGGVLKDIEVLQFLGDSTRSLKIFSF